MKKLNLTMAIFGSLLFSVAVIFSACDTLEDVGIDDVQDVAALVDQFSDQTGYNFSSEKPVESDINFSSSYGSSSDLPSSVDLTDKCPPIGNQGAYGTCVAWSVGYGLKTFLAAMDQGWTTSDMASTSKQFSARYLFTAIDAADKGDDCGGTYFETALDVVQLKGLPLESSCPYEDLVCSENPSQWDSEAASYKIENYRQIDYDVQTLKQYLSDKRVISFGAKLGDNFMATDDATVLSTETYDYAGQHAYHAMLLVGYDDSKGSNGAFRVMNSWGSSWGDNGFIWVDQNFFANEFCFGAYVAKNKPSDDWEPDNNDDDVVSGDVDVLPWELNDYERTEDGGGTKRGIKYDVYNIGDQAATADMDWAVIYCYYDAYDPENDWGIIIYDYYSDDFGSPGDDGDMNADDMPSSDLMGIAGNWYNYVDLAAGKSASEALYGEEVGFDFKYTMPTSLDGEYYLCLIADGLDAINEYDESNNYLFFSQSNGDPIVINNGEIASSNSLKALKGGYSAPTKGADSPCETLATGENANTYTPQEIQKLINYHLETGEIQRKARQFKSFSANPEHVKTPAK